MADFDADKFLAETAPPSFDPDQFLKETDPRQAASNADSLGGYADALGRGVAQGATLDFADEGVGAVKSTPALLHYFASKLGMAPDSSFEEVAKKYKEGRDEYRKNDEAAKSLHPNYFTGGEIGGGLATAFLPGVGALNVGKGVRGLNFLAQSVGKGALQGAIAGAGEAGELSDVPDDAYHGAKVGAAVGAVAPAVGKVAGGIADKLRLKKLASTFLGSSEDAVDRYIKDPNAVMTAPTVEQSVGSVKDTLKKLREAVTSGSKMSRQDLSEEGVQKFTGSEIGRFYLDKVDDILKNADGALTSKEAATVEWMKRQAKPFMTKKIAPKKFSPERVKDLIQEADSMTKSAYSNHPADFTAPDLSHIVDVRRNMNKELRSRAPQYGETMDEVSRQTGMLDDVGSLFRSDQGLANTLNRVRRGRAPFAEQQFQGLDKEFGTNTVEDLRNALARESFEKGAQGPGGSQKVNLYKGIFEDALGKIPGGKFIGGSIGATIDKHGPGIGKGMIDNAMQLKELLNSVPGMQSLGKYGKILADAASRGNSSLAITHALLMKNDPEYASKFNEPSQ